MNGPHGVTGAGRWCYRVDHGRRWTEAEVDQAYSLRLSIFDLKSNEDRPADRAAFGAFIRGGLVVRVHDGRDALHGMLAVRWEDVVAEDGVHRLFLPEFIFLTPEARRRTVLPWMLGRLCFSALPAMFRRRTWLGGFGYPTGVLALDRLGAGVIFDDDPEAAHTGPRELFEWLRRWAGPRWDGRTKVMPTLPRGVSEPWVARHADDAIFQHYERRSPQWRAGFSPPILCRVGLIRTPLGIGKRWWARLRGGDGSARVTLPAGDTHETT